MRPSPAHRWLVVVLAVIGALVAARLALYQLDLTARPWDPIFGDGTRAVLRSRFSEALPIPDALLGALAYAAEATLAHSRHERLSSFVAALMAIGGIALVAVQALAIHAFCTLCLVSAALSLVLAAVQLVHLRRNEEVST